MKVALYIEIFTHTCRHNPHVMMSLNLELLASSQCSRGKQILETELTFIILTFKPAGPSLCSLHCTPLMTSLSQTLRFKVHITYHPSRIPFLDFRKKTVTENRGNRKSVLYV